MWAGLRRLSLNDAAPSSPESLQNATAASCASVSLKNWLAASISDGDSTTQPGGPGDAPAQHPEPSTPVTTADAAATVPDSAFAWSLPPPSSATSLANRSTDASPLPYRQRAAGASPVSSIGDNSAAPEDSGDAAAAALLMLGNSAQPDDGARLTWHTNELADCVPTAADDGDQRHSGAHVQSLLLGPAEVRPC